jgi:hypothetical protein
MKIRWNGHTKVQNKALGLPGPDVSYAVGGSEMEVDAKALAAIEKRYGPAAFVVIQEEKPAKSGKGTSK